MKITITFEIEDNSVVAGDILVLLRDAMKAFLEARGGGNIASYLASQGIEPGTALYAGKVARLRNRFGWAELIGRHLTPANIRIE